MRRLVHYIYEYPQWPSFTWDTGSLLAILSKVRNRQGRMHGHLEVLGFRLRDETLMETLTKDVVKSNEIEGEILNPEQVRSSVAKYLGMAVPGLLPADKYVDGVVEMMLDATQHFKKPLTKKRLFAWHSALFPQGKSGMPKIEVGKWRTGPMQVVSGAMGRERVHFEAPEANVLEKEMTLFLDWFNTDNFPDPVLKAAIAHLWFVTLHPFDDGNGRIARAVTDMQLARADGDNQRFYSMSAQIRLERNAYYEMLEKTQKGTLNVTAWLQWFLHCLDGALNASEEKLSSVLNKTKFWDKHSDTPVNERQRLMVNKLFDGFTGNLTSSKWAKITKCSADTALRDIQDLVAKNILQKENAGGRSTHYVLAEL